MSKPVTTPGTLGAPDSSGAVPEPSHDTNPSSSLALAAVSASPDPQAGRIPSETTRCVSRSRDAGPPVEVGLHSGWSPPAAPTAAVLAVVLLWTSSLLSLPPDSAGVQWPSSLSHDGLNNLMAVTPLERYAAFLEGHATVFNGQPVSALLFLSRDGAIPYLWDGHSFVLRPTIPGIYRWNDAWIARAHIEDTLFGASWTDHAPDTPVVAPEPPTPRESLAGDWSVHGPASPSARQQSVVVATSVPDRETCVPRTPALEPRRESLPGPTSIPSAIPPRRERDNRPFVVPPIGRRSSAVIRWPSVVGIALIFCLITVSYFWFKRLRSHPSVADLMAQQDARIRAISNLVTRLAQAQGGRK